MSQPGLTSRFSVKFARPLRLSFAILCHGKTTAYSCNNSHNNYAEYIKIFFIASNAPDTAKAIVPISSAMRTIGFITNYSPISSLTSLNFLQTKIISSLESAAESCVRILALPLGTTG